MSELAPSHALKLMVEHGGEFWKFHYKKTGKPARTHVQLLVDPYDSDRDAIAWKDVGDRSWMASIALNDIVEIKEGPVSRTFTQNHHSVINPMTCFSICTRARTLDLEAVHPEDFRVWLLGLTYIVDPNKSGAGSQRHVQPGSQGGISLAELEDHLEGYTPGDSLSGIAEWVALKRRQSRDVRLKVVRNPAPEPVDVDQMFLVGSYRQGAVNGSCCAATSFPVPATNMHPGQYRGY